MRPLPKGFMDVTPVLRAGVYLLSEAGRVVYIGRSKSVYAKISAHRGMLRRGELRPAWAPLRPVAFDSVAVRTCRPDQLDEVYAEACAETGWREPTTVRQAFGIIARRA